MSWFAVYTQTGKEIVAAQNLLRQGFEPYVPRYRKRRRHARRTEMVLSPLFPRYLFVRMNPAQQRWRAINGTIGVCHLLTDGSTPLPVDEAIIEAIRSHEEAGVVVVRPREYQKGQALRVTEGPFAELEGLFECMDDEYRVVLMLDFMGRSVRTRLPGHAVTAA